MGEINWFSVVLTPWLTGAGARSAKGTDIGHENAEGMAYVGVRVEPAVRLGHEVEGHATVHGLSLFRRCNLRNNRATFAQCVQCFSAHNHWKYSIQPKIRVELFVAIQALI